MRKASIALLGTAPLLFIAAATIAAQGPKQTVLLPHFLFVPGPVTGNRADGINGSFTMTQATAPNGSPVNGVTSLDQLGGACIIFRLQDLDPSLTGAKVCTTDEDCRSETVAGYCHADTHECWGRPALPPAQDPLCNRSVDYSPPKSWPLGEVIPISPNPIPVGGYNLKPNAQAVIVALTRGRGNGPPHTVLTWGQPTTIP